MASSRGSLPVTVVLGAAIGACSPAEVPRADHAPPAPTAIPSPSMAVPPTSAASHASDLAPSPPLPAASASATSSAGDGPLRRLHPHPGAEDTPLTVDTLGDLRVGMHVHVIKWDRPISPDESGHDREVSLNRGQHGVVTGFLRRKLAGVTFVVAVVAWDAQTWHEWIPPYKRMKEGHAYDSAEINRMYDEGVEVKLGRFEATTHPELLEADATP